MKYGDEAATLRLIDIYLAVYASLIAGALFTLYRSNVLQRLPQAWIAGIVFAVIALGVLLRMVSRTPKRQPKSGDEGP
jgi:hypothetical protein